MSKKIRLSCDDGCASDVRVAELAKKYGIECVFYWPVEHRSLAYEHGYEPLNLIDQHRIANEFEIGSHTITHRHLTQIDELEAMIEIFDSQALLQRMWDQPIKKFCPPRGYSNKVLTDYTLKFYESQRLTKGPGLVHIHPNSGANDNIHWLEYVKDHEIEEAWFHSWELDLYPDEWLNLEGFLQGSL